MYQHGLGQWAHHHEQGMALAVRLGHVNRITTHRRMCTMEHE